MNNIKKIIMLVFVGILIFFTGFVFAKVLDSDHKEVVKTDNTDSDSKKAVNKSNNNSFKQEENIVFLGDSITEYYPIDEIYGDLPIVKSGVSGYQTKDILSRMDKMVYSYNPTKIFLLIGTNDYMYDTKQETIDNTMKNIKKIVNNRYGVITQALSNLINTGKNIDRIEVLRDFNGWSWTTIKTEIENIQANLVYQTLRIMLDEEFLDGWCQDTDGIIDYVEIMKKELTERYGDLLAEEIIEKIYEIAIIKESEENKEYKDYINKELEKTEKQIQIYNNTQEYVQGISNKKKIATKEIKKIEQILNQESKIKEEYERRNATAPLEQKIFSIRVLKQQLNDRKQQLLNEIEECNYYLNPSNFINEKNKIIRQKELLEVINFNEKQKEEVIIEYINTILKCYEIIVKKEDNDNIMKLIYKFRYFMLVPFNLKKNIKDVEEVEEQVIKTEKILIQKSIEGKVMTQVPIEIMKHVFETRIISLDELYFKITSDFEKYYVQIFDENITEEKFEINTKEKMKINRKIKIFI